jgi:acetyl esterase/lipase
MNLPAAGLHMIVLPGGGYAEHAAHEAEPVASWLGEIGVPANVFRYPLNVRHPAPLDALRAEIARRRANGAQRIGLIGFSAGDRLASALAANQVPHAVHMFAHGPHSLGLARGAGEAAIWTTLASSWIGEQAQAPLRGRAGSRAAPG